MRLVGKSSILPVHCCARYFAISRLIYNYTNTYRAVLEVGQFQDYQNDEASHAFDLIIIENMVVAMKFRIRCTITDYVLTCFSF